MSIFQYILRRLLAMIPTLLGISLVVFFIINLAPGGPIEQKLQKLRFSGVSSQGAGGGQRQQGISEEVIESLKKQYGFDKPLHIRYLIWLKNIFALDFGESYTYEEDVLDVIKSKFPVSIQFGLVSFFLTYLISLPLGMIKAVKHGSSFDIISSLFLFVMYSIPPFMLGILLIVFLAGGSFYDWFPIGGLYSDQYDELNFFGQIKDRIHHFFLPCLCYVIGNFATLTSLMKNSLLDEIKKDYIKTARAKGLSNKTVILKHAFRNALIPIATGIGGLFSLFFAGSFLIETIFQLDGMGLLGFNSLLARDYNVIMGLIFIQSILVLMGNLLSDLTYMLIDPRISLS